MAVSVVEVVKAQTTSSTGALTATFTAAPQVGDRILAFVGFEFNINTGVLPNDTAISISGLGATWRLVTVQRGYNGQLDWYGLYEATNLSGSGSTVNVTESSSVTTANFSVACFNLRGIPTGSLASAVYGFSQGATTSNPPAVTVTPQAAGDLVVGSWYQQSSATAPTITTIPASGYNSFSTTMTAMSIHWRYMVATDTSTYSMDSGTAALYSSFGVASVLGAARILYGGLETMVVATAPLRRYSQAQLEVVSSSANRRYSQTQLEVAVAAINRRYSQTLLEVLVARRQFKGWGVPI